MKKIYILALTLICVPALSVTNSCKDAGRQCYQDCQTLEGGCMHVCNAACALAYLLKCGIENQTDEDEKQQKIDVESMKKNVPNREINDPDEETYRFPRLCASVYRTCRGHCAENPGCAAACDAAYRTCMHNFMFKQAAQISEAKKD